MVDTKRVAKHDETPDALPEITQSFLMSTTEVPNGVAVDPFSQQAEIVKSYGGTSSNFKRKVTNEIKKSNELTKYNRSADGKTQSKQIDDNTEVTGYDAFGVVTPPENLEALGEIYQRTSSPHYAAVNAKVDNIVGLGFNLVETSKTKRGLEALDGNEKKLKKVRQSLSLHKEELFEQIEGFNENLNFTEVLSRVWRDYEVTGNGYLEVGRKRDGTIGYVGHVPAHSIRVRKARDGFVQLSANKAQFFLNFGDKKTPNPIGDYEPNELIHILRHSPVSSYYGVPDIVAAQSAIAGNEFAARYNLEFFQNKAIPRHLITIKGANIGQSSLTDLFTFFETGLKGQNHRSLIIPLPADQGDNKVEFNIEAIDAKVQESSFDKYLKSNQAQILMAHRVPLSKVDTATGASLSIARDADKTFKEQVCGPQQRGLEKQINRIVKELTDAFEFKLNEMTLTDENTQSQIDERRRKTGTETANEQRARRGLPTIEGGDELVDLNAKDKIAAQSAEDAAVRERDADRSANQTDNAGESREPKGEGRAQG